MLATIASRVKTIPLVREKKEDLANIVKEIEADDKKRKITLDVAQGNLGKALSVIKNEVYFNIYYFCLDLIGKMNHSKNVLYYSSTIEKNKKFIDIYLEVLTMFYRDMLVLKEGVKTAIINENEVAYLELISQNYSKMSIIKVLQKLEQAKKMIEFNTNLVAVLDALLLGILEVKYKWKVV
ncbi:MAG: hypothetical protein CVV59_02000 [Tenericutes bacterium HGW-Tenericutes-4]|nr:MAG: hypothetical protein CVV59_02000 [Tenericutes bacterium HGW-Tenericutes-4]